jgi:hypothetical protein
MYIGVSSVKRYVPTLFMNEKDNAKNSSQITTIGLLNLGILKLKLHS